MATQRSMLKYRGSLDGIRHYTVKGTGKDFAAYVRSVDGDRIKNGAEYERTRENMNEFGGCGVAVSSLRNGLAPVIDQMSDKKMTARAIRVVKQINLTDESEARGYRAILFTKSGALLERFLFDENRALMDFYKNGCSVSHTADRGSATVTFPAAEASQLKAPVGSTHFRIVNALSLLSDFAYNSLTRQYEPVEKALNQKYAIAYSEYMEVKKSASLDEIVVTATLAVGEALKTAKVACLHSVGIEFATKAGDTYCKLNKCAMEIAAVF